MTEEQSNPTGEETERYLQDLFAKLAQDDQNLLDTINKIETGGRYLYDLYWQDWQPENWRRRSLVHLIGLYKEIGQFLEKDEQAQGIIKENIV